jgi:hypothetical protein
MQPKQEGLDEKTGAFGGTAEDLQRVQLSGLVSLRRRMTMQFREAFERLGYLLEVPRQDWSAD